MAQRASHTLPPPQKALLHSQPRPVARATAAVKAVRHLSLDPPEIIEIGLAYPDVPAPAAEAFLKFIKGQLP